MLEEADSEFQKRVRHYYPLKCMFNKSKVGTVTRKISGIIQDVLKIDRNKHENIVYGLGSQWFSITDAFARYVCSQEKLIRRVCRYGFCVDEIVIQTMWLQWNNPTKRRFQNSGNEHFAEDLMEILRAIDWSRGKPYTFRSTDYDMLINCGCLFARKFDESIDSIIIEKIAKHVRK